MSEVQEHTNINADPRWITVRVSRINLAVTLIGALLAFPGLFLVPLSAQVRIALLVAFVLAIAWDLYLIFLKSPDSARAFYLFDLDVPKSALTPGKVEKSSSADPVLGVQMRVTGSSLLGAEKSGVVLRAAFVSPWFTALRYRLPNDPAWRRYWPHVIPLWSDSIDKEEFRKIRVALRWK